LPKSLKPLTSSTLKNYYDKPRSSDVRMGHRSTPKINKKMFYDDSLRVQDVAEESVFDPRTFLAPFLAAPFVFGAPAMLAAPSLLLLPLVIAPLVLIFIIMLV